MKRIARNLTVFGVFGVVLQGCTSMFHSKQSALELELKAPSPNRLRFEGKGAGAGIALMSTMGPMGIAIGVAIDEGIANTLNEQLADTNSALLDDLKEALAHQLSTTLSGNTSQHWGLQIERYGLKTVAGSDRSLVTLSANLTDGQQNYALSWPTDWVATSVADQSKDESLPKCLWDDLESLKKNGEKIAALWQCSVQYYVPKALNELQ